MTGLEDAIHHYLSGEATISRLAGTRVFKTRRPAGSRLPGITINELTAAGGHHQAGAAGSVTTRVQIDCWADTRSAAVELREAIRELMDGYPAGTIGPPGDTITIEGIHVDNRLLQHHETETAHGTSDVYQGILDLIVWHRESVPSF